MGIIKIGQVFALGCYLFECIMISAKPAKTCLIVGAPVEFYVSFSYDRRWYRVLFDGWIPKLRLPVRIFLWMVEPWQSTFWVVMRHLPSSLVARNPDTLQPPCWGSKRTRRKTLRPPHKGLKSFWFDKCFFSFFAGSEGTNTHKDPMRYCSAIIRRLLMNTKWVCPEALNKVKNASHNEMVLCVGLSTSG